MRSETAFVAGMVWYVEITDVTLVLPPCPQCLSSDSSCPSDGLGCRDVVGNGDNLLVYSSPSLLLFDTPPSSPSSPRPRWPRPAQQTSSSRSTRDLELWPLALLGEMAFHEYVAVIG